MIRGQENMTYGEQVGKTKIQAGEEKIKGGYIKGCYKYDGDQFLCAHRDRTSSKNLKLQQMNFREFFLIPNITTILVKC